MSDLFCSVDLMPIVAKFFLTSTKETTPPLALLKPLTVFALINKNCHAIIHDLLYAQTEAAAKFNNELIELLTKKFEGKTNPQLLATAYFNTPYASKKLNDYFINHSIEECLKALEIKIKISYYEIPYYRSVMSPYPIVVPTRTREEKTLAFDETLPLLPSSTKTTLKNFIK